jgi:hypothetical protein
MEDLPQSQEELDAHFGPSGPVTAAADWLYLVTSGDLRQAWPRTDPTLRLVLAQAWLWANRSHVLVRPYDIEEAAPRLAGLTFDHELWPHFEETQVGEFAENFGDYDRSRWGAGSRPRPIPPDYEIVKFFDTDGQVLHFDEPTFIEGGIKLLVRSTPEGWVVAGFGEEPPVPGWPPEPGFVGY